ncbi:hypothetical protein PHMEG_00030508, partial [Phytophthora megakarya]
LKIKDGNAKERREHVDHYIETLNDQDLAERLTLLRLTDADDLEEVLRARERAKNRQKKAVFGSSKYRSVSDIASHRKIFLAANEDVTPKLEKESANLDPRLPDRDQGHQDHNLKIHGNGFNRDRGHPSDHCLFVCRGCGELHDMGKCPMEEFYNQIRQWFNPTKHMGMLPEAAEKIQQDPDLWFKPTDHEVTPEIQRPSKIAEYRRSTTMDLLSGESRDYWKHHSPGKWFRQAKITGKIHNEKAILLLDTGAEVSIVDTAFARRAGCYIDSSQIEDCVGIGGNVYQTEGRTRIKVTLVGSEVYFFDIWVGDLTGQQAILGMDFMVPAGIRLDLAHGSISLTDEVRIQLSGRRQLYSDKAKIVNVDQYVQIQAGESVELPLRLRSSVHDKLWITRGDQWMPTISGGPGRTKYVSITNIGDEVLILYQDQPIGIWLAGDHVPRIPGFISIGSRRYMEWQNLALEATAYTRSEGIEAKIPLVPAVERPEYETPRMILPRPKTTLIQRLMVDASTDCLPSDDSPSDKSPSDKHEDSILHAVTVKEALEDLDQVTPDIWATNLSVGKTTDVEGMREEDARDEIEGVSQDQLYSRGQDQGTSPSKCGGSDLPSTMSVQPGTGHVTGDPLNDKCDASMSQKTDMDPSPVVEDQPGTSDLDLTWDSDQDYDECVYYHDRSDLYAEDVDGQMAVLPEVPVTTEDVRIEDIQLC